MPAPLHPLPPLVVALAGSILATEGALQLGTAGLLGGPEALGWRLDLARALGFHRALFDHMRAIGQPAPDLYRALTYWIVHGGLLHSLFAVVLLAALGQAVRARFGASGLAVTLLAGALGGALAFGLAGPARGVLIGAYPLVYGLIGAFTLGLLQRAADTRARLAAFRLIAVLAGAQLVFRLGFGAGGAEWIAEAGGFGAGFTAALVLGPEGTARLDRLRSR